MQVPEWILTIRKRSLTRAQLQHVVYVGWAWTHSLFAVIGALGMIAVLFFYMQGLRAARPFEPTALDAAAEFAAQVLREDAASALVVSMPLAEGVKPKEVVERMKSKARELDIRYIADYKLHNAVEKVTGEKVRHAEVISFCNPVNAYQALSHNPSYLIHMPCRIGLYEDEKGRFHLLTMNLNLLIHGSKNWNSEQKLNALEIQDSLLTIMAAGSSVGMVTHKP